MKAPAPGPRARLIIGLLAASVLLYVYLPTLAWLGRQWLGDGPFGREARDWSHGPLVVLLVGYLLWQHRREFSSTGASLWGMPLILAGVGLHGASSALEAPYLSAYSLIPVVAGLAYLFSGARTGLRLLTLLLPFLLAVPFPADQWGVTGFLAQVVAIASAFLAGLAGAPIQRSGQFIAVGQYEYSVEPLCSGFNLIMALLALVVPLLYLRRASLKTLGAALLWVPALGLSAKVILVSAVLALTPWLGQDTALMLYHRWLGIPFYLASLGLAVLLIIPKTGKAPIKGIRTPRRAYSVKEIGGPAG